MLRIGSVRIRPNDYCEVKGPNEMWIWHNDVITVLLSNSSLMSRLIREWQEENRTDETHEAGSGI